MDIYINVYELFYLNTGDMSNEVILGSVKLTILDPAFSDVALVFQRGLKQFELPLSFTILS